MGYWSHKYQPNQENMKLKRQSFLGVRHERVERVKEGVYGYKIVSLGGKNFIVDNNGDIDYTLPVFLIGKGFNRSEKAHRESPGLKDIAIKTLMDKKTITTYALYQTDLFIKSSLLHSSPRSSEEEDTSQITISFEETQGVRSVLLFPTERYVGDNQFACSKIVYISCSLYDNYPSKLGHLYRILTLNKSGETFLDVRAPRFISSAGPLNISIDIEGKDPPVTKSLSLAMKDYPNYSFGYAVIEEDNTINPYHRKGDNLVLFSVVNSNLLLGLDKVEGDKDYLDYLELRSISEKYKLRIISEK